MKNLILLLSVSLVLAACNESTDGGSVPSVQVAKTAVTNQETFLVPLILPEVPPEAPSPQFVTTDIEQVDYSCADGTSAAGTSVSRWAYPGRTLKLCADLNSLSSIAGVVANNIMSLCFTSTQATTANRSIFGIRAYNNQRRPAQVQLTGIPCLPAIVLNPRGS